MSSQLALARHELHLIELMVIEERSMLEEHERSERARAIHRRRASAVSGKGLARRERQRVKTAVEPAHSSECSFN